MFVSHKFVKPDQELARLLKRQLRKNSIGGYLAEQTREFDISLNQKIRDNIDKSDYVVVIITKNSINSPSVHQEIGYAIGTNCPIRFMVETDEVPGVLVKDREVEEFTRDTFENKLDIIINDILDKGVRKKIKSKEFQDLIEHVYDPCYNQMKNEYDRDAFIVAIPPNPWKDMISHRWRLKTESDIKLLFESYSKELEIWHMMWRNFEDKFQENRTEIAKIVQDVFTNYNILDENNRFSFSYDHFDSETWLHNCSQVIFDDRISDPKKLYQILRINVAKRYGNEYATGFDDWQESMPQLFDGILRVIPQMIQLLDTKFTYSEIDKQREKLRTSIVKLVESLEEKF